MNTPDTRGWGYRSAPRPAPPPDEKRTARILSGILIGVVDVIAVWAFFGWWCAGAMAIAATAFLFILARRRS